MLWQGISKLSKCWEKKGKQRCPQKISVFSTPFCCKVSKNTHQQSSVLNCLFSYETLFLCFFTLGCWPPFKDPPTIFGGQVYILCDKFKCLILNTNGPLRLWVSLNHTPHFPPKKSFQTTIQNSVILFISNDGWFFLSFPDLFCWIHNKPGIYEIFRK